MPSWDVIINWNAVLARMGLTPEDLGNLPKGAREQAVAEVEALFGAEALFEKDPQEIDNLITESLKRILVKKNYFQKREKEREKAKKEYANNLPRIEVFPADGLPEEFKQMLQDAMDNGQAGDLKDMFEEFFSKYYKSKGNKGKAKDRKSADEDEDPNRSMYI
jgi:hypothetical protein